MSHLIGQRLVWRCRTAFLVLCLTVIGLGYSVAPVMAAGRTTPPPVPACYHTDGGCPGFGWRGHIEPVEETGASHGTFSLSGPAPLQSTSPVACGDLGCLYNHLNWGVGAGGTVVSGCDVNESVCKVKVAPGASDWVPVIVNQNDNPQALFLLWTPAHAVSISGEIVLDGSHTVVAGVTVSAHGSSGGGTATTDSQGKYRLDVPRGHYTVTPRSRGHVFVPRTREVAAQGDEKGVDFKEVSPRLSVAVSPTVPPGGLGVGDTLTVPVTVTAVAADITSITLGDGLVLEGDAAVVSQSPGPIAGFSLASGRSRTFLYKVSATKPGRVTLSAAAAGTTAAGAGVSGDDTTSFPVSTKQLAITMASSPAKVTLTADDAGKIAPKTIKVRVRLTNSGKVRLAAVQLLSLRPVPADPTQQLDQLAFPSGALPVKVGPIAPGASKVKTLSLKVTGDGAYVIRALALYADGSQSGGNARAVAQGGAFTVTAPLLYFKAGLEPPLKNTVQGGESWFVTGHVKNLSSFQTLCLSPLSPKWVGNAGGLGPHQIGVVPVDDPAPPLAGTLAPGKTISFLMRADTSFGGVQRGGVVLEPRASKGEPGDACNVLVTDKAPALTASQIKVAKDSTTFSVHVQHLFPPGPSGAGALEFFGSYAEGSYKVLAKLYQGGLSIADQYGSADKLVAALKRIDPARGVELAEEALSEMAHACAMTANFWIYATPEERDAVLSQIADDFAAQSHAVWDGVQAAVQQSARGWFDSVVQAYYDGDTTTMFKALGGSAGEGLTASAIEMAKFEVGLALLKQTGRVFTVFKRTAAESGVIARLKEVPAGRILKFEEMRRLWGLAQSDLTAFQTIAREERVLIGVRGRSPISVTNLDEGAVWKHEHLKPKNVNDIDTRFLGFDKSDNGLVAFRTYTFDQKQAIRRKIVTSGLDAEQQAAALDRAQTRFGESKYLRTIEGYAKEGQIDVGFNYADNGLDEQSTSVVRKFALDAKDLKGGGVYYRPLQENIALDSLASGTSSLPQWCKRLLAKVLCRVTGDMDGVYLTDLAGRALTETKRLAVYKRLAAVGWQHPETLTWIKNSGEFFFSAKKKILAGLELGGESMMEFSPDPFVRATYLDLKKSVLTGKDTYFAAIIGGFTAFR